MNEILFSLWLSIQSSNVSVDYSPQLHVSSIENQISDKTEIDGESGLVFDVNSSSILWGTNIDNRLPMASLTKLMTALIIIENHSLNEEVQVSSNAMYTDGAKVYLNKGEYFSVGELLSAILIRSGNDAAIALAEYHSGTEAFFVREMNTRAYELGLKNTHFENATGFDKDGHYSSSYDLALLSAALLRNDFIKTQVSRKMGTIVSLSGRKISFYSTNQLLGGSIRGLKTGTTPAAGECLITYIEKDGKNLLLVLLGSKNRFDTTEELIRFVFDRI